MAEPKARDHSANPTGLVETGMPMVKIVSKEAMFEIGDKKQDSYAAFLERVDMEWQEALPEHDLPARWSINLIVAEVENGVEARKRLALSSHWQNGIMAKIINAIRGGLDTQRWKEDPNNRWFRIYLKKKEPKVAGGRATATALVFKSMAFGDWLETQFPFEEGAKSPSGVPEDLKEQTLFWLAIAKQCVDITGGVVTGADKATIKFAGLAATNPSNAAAAATAPAPAPQAATITKYEEALLKHLNIILADPIDTAEEKSAKMLAMHADLLVKADPAKHGHSEEWLKGRIILFATANGIPDPFSDLPF